MKTFQLLSPLLCLLCLGPAFGQKKVLGRPEIFERPMDLAGPDLGNMIGEGARDKSEEIPWLVVSDRDENPVYSRPNGAPTGRNLNFRDWFYVVDEEKDWIKIAKATLVKELKIEAVTDEVGWVPKKSMLLWTAGLLNPATKIHQKAFLLNRADAVENILRDRKEFAEIFKGPNTNQKEPAIKIYSCYFILKKENGKYLLCKQDAYSRRTTDDIIGWVHQWRCAEWNTRICLEPNFDSLPFWERKNNPALQVKAFTSRTAAIDQFSKGSADGTKVFWQHDPAGLPEKYLSDGNPRRFKGGVIRFPVLARDRDADGPNVFRSGVIGKVTVRVDDQNNRIVSTTTMDEPDFALMKKYAEEARSKTGRVNVFLAVEYSPAMSGFKSALPALMDQIKTAFKEKAADLKMGILLYRDASQGQDPLHLKPLTYEYESLKTFAAGVDFMGGRSQHGFTSLYHAINTAVTEGGMDENATNVLLVLGTSGDYRYVDDLRKNAEERKDKTFVDKRILAQNLARYNVRLFAVQCKNDGSDQHDWFVNHARALVLEGARTSYNATYGNQTDPNAQKVRQKASENGFRSDEPLIDIDEAKGTQYLRESIIPGGVRLPKNADLRANVGEVIQLSEQFSSRWADALSAVFDKGEEFDMSKIDAGPIVAPAFQKMLYDMAKDGVPFPDLEKGVEERYQLYHEVYFPRQIMGSNYPSFSYVMFMPEADLRNYRDMIRGCIKDHGNMSPDKKREMLFDIYKDLFVLFTGNENLRQRLETATTQDLVGVMNGMDAEVSLFKLKYNTPLAGIRDKDKIKDPQIEAMLDRFADVARFLDDVLRQTAKYPFLYTSGDDNHYYWIPIEDTF